MRKNTAQTLKAFSAGLSARPAESIWTNGETIFSYGTALATRIRTPGERGETAVLLNRTKYSVTTSIHQNALAYGLTAQGFPVIEVEDVPQGASRATLVATYAVASTVEV